MMDEMIITTNEVNNTNKFMDFIICFIVAVISTVMIFGSVVQFMGQNVTSGILYMVMGIGAIILAVAYKKGNIEEL
jgi:hypothetical protein